MHLLWETVSMKVQLPLEASLGFLVQTPKDHSISCGKVYKLTLSRKTSINHKENKTPYLICVEEMNSKWKSDIPCQKNALSTV